MLSNRSLTGKLLILVVVAVAGAALAACGSLAEEVVSEPVVEQPVVEEPAAEEPAEQAPAEEMPEEQEAPAEAVVIENTKLSLNDASGEEYQAAIPGFSDRMVREFFEYRPYISIQQFRREMAKYIDDATIAMYEQYVYVPVDVDEADAETMMQLPGVDAVLAEQLIAGRPYGSNEAFLEALAQVVTAEDAAAAQGYLAQ